MLKPFVLGALACLATACLATACLATAGSAPAAEQAAPAAAASIVVSGTVKIVVSAVAGPSLANGTMVSVSPSLRVGDTTSTNQLFVYASTQVSNGKVTYSITLPYKWAVAARSDLISVSLGLQGSSTNGYESTYFSKTFAIPANGTTTTVHFVGAV